MRQIIYIPPSPPPPPACGTYPRKSHCTANDDLLAKQVEGAADIGLVQVAIFRAAVHKPISVWCPLGTDRHGTGAADIGADRG